MILLALLLCVQAPQRAATVGLVSTVGDHWQIEMLEAGLAYRPRRGPAAVSIALRVGQFQDESTFKGNARGLVAGATLAWRTRMRRIAEYGTNDSNSTGIGLDMTIEATGYAAARPPAGYPRRWLAVSALGGLGVGNGRRLHAALMLGPTLFLNKVHALMALRAELPI